jgi:RecA/RadA recombinase
MPPKRAKKPTSKKAKAEAQLLSAEELAQKIEERKAVNASYASLPKAERMAIVRQRISADGRAVVVTAEDADLPYHIRRPFGIASLDIGCAGGPPAGTFVVVWGKPGAGKNFIINMLLRNIQKNFGDEAAINFSSFGYQFDKPWAIKHGLHVPMTEAEIAAAAYNKGGLTAEEEALFRKRVGFFDLTYPNLMTEGVIDSPAESMLQGCLDQIASGEYQAVVIDEANVASTREDLARTMSDEPKTAGLARMMTQFMGRMLAALARPCADGSSNKTTVIMILESRDLIGGTMPGMTRQSGGEAKNHIKVFDINLSTGEPIMNGQHHVGKQIKYRVTKGKMGAHEGATGILDFYFANADDPGGIDTVKDLASELVKQGVIGVAGTWYSAPDGTRIGQGINSVKAWLMAEPGRADEMYDQVLLKAGYRIVVT